MLPVTQFAQVEDVGVQLIVQCLDQDGAIIDIGAATAISIKLLYPDETTTKDCAAALYTDGSDGKMVYVTQANDLSQAGLYSVQGKVTFGSGSTVLFGSLGYLQVFTNVDNG